MTAFDTRHRLAADVVDAGVRAESRGESVLVLIDHADAPDPALVLAAVAPRTSRIRLVAHVDSSATHPYSFARKLVALDKLSAGRAGWYVTDTVEARRDEFIDLTERLVSSWEPGALVADKAAGVYVDVSRVHPVEHDGIYWSTQSSLDVGPGPQGVPPRLTEDVTFEVIS